MHIHLLGICGTFMGGIAAIARAAGHKVTGCDANVYPPMSTQLEAQGIELIEGFSLDQIKLAPDLFVAGNVVARGNPLMEEILNRSLPYTSGPQWLSENVLRDQWVLAVAGTHGKTTTTAMLAWMLEYGGLHPGFLVGGVPENFGVSARLTASSFFVIEADEYDTAFFDKRSKFVHYHPRTAILNNLEFDHADIFADLAAIETQFHHLLRTVPGNGLIVSNGGDANLERVLKRGCWTPVERYGVAGGWQAGARHTHERHAATRLTHERHAATRLSDGFDVLFNGAVQGRVRWDLLGEHNVANALAAIAAARHAGVPANVAIEALSTFKNVKRRMEVKGAANGVTVYDDFAHHPTAIATTIAGLRAKIGNARLIAVLEPRSNTMKQGALKDQLAGSLADADFIFCYSAGLDWNAAAALAPLGAKASVSASMDELIGRIASTARAGDHVLIMSNGEFGGIHDKLLRALSQMAREDAV